MFDSFSQKITKIFDKISGKKIISQDDLDLALREIRIALLEADVALNVAKDFIEKVKVEALGKEVIKSISAGEMIVKIVHDQLVELLGSESNAINFNSNPPLIILMVGLQGSGKTTSTAKLAARLKNKNHKKILLASLDTYRPGAFTQMQTLAQKVNIDCCQFDDKKSPLTLAIEAQKKAQEGGYDVLILDSAGRIAIDQEMMQELKNINQKVNAQEIILVVDAMIGQDAINVAKNFQEILPLTGVILTRLDGDARAGCALTMKATTNCPIKYVGVGEKISDFEEFHPKRIASQIIGMGDVVSLVEKAQEIFDAEEMAKDAKKIKDGDIDFNMILSQIRNMKKIGGLAGIVKFIPGAGKIKEHLGQLGNVEKDLKIQESIILSMTKKERANPEILSSSRKHRIAKGSGTSIQEVNRLMKKYKQLRKMMDKFGKIDPKKMQEMMDNPNLANNPKLF
ncbi:signal recognition particle protein [Alphaproteobacteria bacterium]|nr:signal recognition particle protein [Alphaproteobacteria bacterium]